MFKSSISSSETLMLHFKSIFKWPLTDSMSWDYGIISELPAGSVRYTLWMKLHLS